jgi:hypothetical protein
MKNILVIRPGAIGDTLLTFPVLKTLREFYDAACITLVGNAQVLPLAIASGVVEQAFDFQDIQWSELFSSQGVRTSSLCELLVQTDYAICWMRDPVGLVEHNLKTMGVKLVIIAPGRPPVGEHTHIIDYLAQSIGLPSLTPQFLSTPVGARVDERSLGGPLWLPAPGGHDRCSDFPTTTFEPFVAIHSGSGAAEKCWPVSRFAEIIKHLWKQNQPVLLLSGPADTERLEGILKLLSPSPAPDMFKILTSAPLLEVAEYLQQCKCYLGNDSGITHLAAMLGVPTVAIFGPTDPLVWRPIGPSVKVIYGSQIEAIAEGVVFEAVISYSLGTL